MAKLSATLSLVDGFSNRLNNINRSLQQSGERMNAFKRVLSAIDTSGLDRAANSSSGMFKSMLGANLVTQGIGALSNGVRGMVGELSNASATWKTFQGNMDMIGKTPEQIKAVKTELQDFATKTIYSASDMASTYSQLEAVGIKSADKLTMGFGGLAAAAADPTQAMKTLSQQATQMAAKPSVQWADFKLMLEQTPAGISQVAKTMNMTTGEMVKAVQDGTIKTQDFFDAITTTGTNEKFTQMATQFKTVRQAMDGFKEGLTNKLQPTFDKMSKYGIKAFDSLSKYVDKINFDKIGDKLIQFIEKTKESAKQFWSAFKDSGALSAVSSAFNAIGSAIGHISSSLSSGGNGVKSFGAALGGITKSVAGTIESIANAISKMSPSQIKSVAGGLKAAAAAMFGFKVASAAFGQGLAVYKGISGTISTIKNLNSALKGSRAISAAPSIPPAPSGAGAAGWVNAAKKAGTLLAVAGSIKLVASAFQDVANVNVSWAQLGQNLAQMGVFLTVGAVSMALIGAGVNKFAALQSSLATGAVTFIAIAGTLAIVGKALEVVASVKLGTVQTALSQLAVMGTMLGAAAVAMGVVGGAIMLFPPIAAAIGIGAAVFIGIAASMALVGAGLLVFAKEVKVIISTINSIKIESNIGEKLAQIVKVMTSLSVVGGLTSVIGALVAPFAVLGAIGYGAIITSITKVADFANKLSSTKIPPAGSVKPKLKQIQGFAKALTSFKLGKVGNVGAVFSSAFASLTTGNIIGTFKKVADFVQQISAMPSVDSSNLQTKFKMLAGIKKALNKAAQGSSTGGNSVDASFNSFFQKLDTGNIISSFQKVTDFVKKLSSMDTIDAADLDSKFTQIKNVLNEIRDFASEKFDNSLWDSLKSFFGKLDTSNLVSSFTKVADLTKKISALPKLGKKALDGKFKSIKSVFDKLKNFKIEAPSDNLSTSMKAVEKIVNPLTQISKKFQSLNGVVVNSTNIIATMNAIKSIIDFLPNLKFTAPEGFDTSIANIVKPISSLTSVAKKLQELSGLVVNSVNVINTMNAINDIVKSLSTTFATPLDENIGANLKSIIKPISSLMAVANKLQELSGVVVNSTAVIATMTAITSIVSDGAWITIKSVISKVSGLQDSFETASAALSSLSSMVGALNGIPTVTATISANVTAIQTALDSLSKLTVSGNIAGQLQAITTSVNTTLSAIEAFASQTSAAGVNAGQGFANGLSAGFSQALGIAQSTASLISGSLSGISLYSAGAAIGQSLVSGLSSQMGSVVATAQALGAAIKANKGPIEYDRIMLVENGSVIVTGLINGLMSQKNNLIKSAQSLGDSIQGNATIGLSLQNGDVPRKDLPKSGVTNQNTTNSSKKVEINLGGITIQGSGNTNQDADVMAEQVAQKIMKAVNASLA
ncbi:hypothetical protein EFL96_06330 [Lactococcus lactis]|uniref:tape measure protein n=1 Tax=Lactococcus lactis TaxID=1358 RepID=UPI00223B682A|nr:tape measure protein [Lactococcus lactis]MCT1186484.1 hypothetical protein [Lactococcus lactis]MCT1189570.1 hypothetical protein [Lactococcus lactis]